MNPISKMIYMVALDPKNVGEISINIYDPKEALAFDELSEKSPYILSDMQVLIDARQ